MASTMVAVGLTIAAAGFAGRYALKAMKHMEPQVKQALQNLPKPTFSGYYRGGFEPKMTKREAALILGVSPTANRSKIREAHRRIMLLNHPDKDERPAYGCALYVRVRVCTCLNKCIGSSPSVVGVEPSVPAEDTELQNISLCDTWEGGSPYVAAKINEAKDLLEDQAKK